MLVVQFESGRELHDVASPATSAGPGCGCCAPDALAAELAHIGPEPLDPAFTPAALAETLQAHPHQLHAFLRDQRAIAGIGRAFANEILHAAMLSPYQRSATLSDAEVERLHAAITGVLGARGRAAGAALGERPHDQGRPRLRRPRPARRALPALRRGASGGCRSTSTPSSTARTARPAIASWPTGACHGCYGSDRPAGRGTIPVMLESSTFTHDLQATEPDVHLALTRAGVTGVDKVIRIAHAGTELALLRPDRLLRRPRPRSEGRAHVPLPRDRGRVHRPGRDRRGAARRGPGRAHRRQDRRAPERRALRGDDPGEVPDHPAHARVRPAHPGDLPPDRAGARQRQRRPPAGRRRRCAG